MWQHAMAYYPNAYTAKRLPVVCIYAEQYTIARVARSRELQLKCWLRRKKYALITGDIPLLMQLAKRRTLHTAIQKIKENIRKKYKRRGHAL